MRALGGEPTRAGIDDLYDAFKQPRGVREALPLLDLAEARAYGDAVRARALERLARGRPRPRRPRPAPAPRLRAPDGRAARAPARRDAAGRHPAAARRARATASTRAAAAARASVVPPAEVLVPAGPFAMGTRRPVAPRQRAAGPRGRPARVLDRRRAGHQRPVPRVRRGRRLRRRAAGGASAGWAWRQEAGLAAPQFWQRDGDGWARLRFGRRRAAARRRARAARLLARGRRLRPLGRPAAAHRGRVGEGGPLRPRHRREPPLAVGRRRPHRRHANLGQRHLGPAPVGAYPAGASAVGCHQMVGDVWEWTASDFRRLPGLRVVPLRGVLRGVLRRRLQGAARRLVGHRPDAPAGTTFRNWDHPDPPPDLRRLPHRAGTR